VEEGVDESIMDRKEKKKLVKEERREKRKHKKELKMAY